MLTGMRTLALDYLVQELHAGNGVDDPDTWYQALQRDTPGKLFPYLVEDSGKIDKVFIVAMTGEDKAGLSLQDVTEAYAPSGCSMDKLPFIKPSGSQSAQFGPVFKRSYTNQTPGPSDKILATTLNSFTEIAKADKPWSAYFSQVLTVLRCKNLTLPDGAEMDWQAAGYESLLSCAIDKIGSQKNTVFLTIRTPDGKLPGEQAVYVEYLMAEKLAGERYVTGSSPASDDHQTCYLCNGGPTTLYPSGLKGAGINFSNTDRAGVFPGLDAAQAWKGFGICRLCADLLYVYKNHVLKKGGPKKDRVPFTARIAGDLALIVPAFPEGIAQAERMEVLRDVQEYIGRMGDNVVIDEDILLETLKDKESILHLSFLWLTIGQNIENVRSMITAVLPSRLRELSALNSAAETWSHPVFPKISLAGTPTDFSPQLSLTALKWLFFRPGGKSAKEINNADQLFQLKKMIADCIYHQRKLPQERFWTEWLITARWYWREALLESDGFKALLYEGNGKKGAYLTAAGWIKQVNWWLYYFKKAGIMDMENEYFEPVMPALKPYFGAQSGINTKEKAFAFLIGVLFGKVMQVQGAKNVNVNANALTWLKRLTLTGKDLPGLYNKIREKTLVYETEKSEKVRALIAEIGGLGVALGDDIRLDEVQTSYYLLLGQSMMGSILPKEKGE